MPGPMPRSLLGLKRHFIITQEAFGHFHQLLSSYAPPIPADPLSLLNMRDPGFPSLSLKFSMPQQYEYGAKLSMSHLQ